MKKRRMIIFTSIFTALVLLSLAAGVYFFNVAQVRAGRDFVPDTFIKKGNPLHEDTQAFFKEKKETWRLKNAEHLNLISWYLPAKVATKKTVLIVHGFGSKKENMAAYAQMFHHLNYNVLLPDNRAHGESEGDLIGYGWNDRKDILEWIQKILEENGKDSEIALFGLSMGAATVMMTSGEKLPNQVKCLIEDCGYDTVWNELVYQAKQTYHLPAFPILYEVSLLSKIRAGFDYKEASSVNQLHQNKRPVLFIHGEEDTYVPTEMVYKNYQATKGTKELLLVKGAEHAKSLETDKELYTKTVERFLTRYFR